jgi:hypothetical protein
MFRWYRGAAKCYVYLADVSISIPSHPRGSAFRTSRWFTRGWTLQELIAPSSVEFFFREGIKLGDKSSLERLIQDAAGVPVAALRGKPLSECSIRE